MDKTKACTKCGKELAEENFRKGNNQCKECVAEYLKKYTQENAVDIAQKKKEYDRVNKERISERDKKYRETNKEKISEKDKKYRKNNKDKILAVSRQYYQKNKEAYAEYAKKYRKINKESIAIGKSKWAKTHKEGANRNVHQRRSRKHLLPATLTLTQWEVIKKHFNNTCCYCGKSLPLEQEHFVALINGGEYSKENILPACRSCNTQKNAKSFFVWYPSHKHYSKQREMKILNCLGYENGVQQISIL